MRIDIHTHAFPQAIAAKGLAAIEHHYGVRPVCSGVVGDLLKRSAQAGFDRVVVLCLALGQAQVIPANNWALALKRDHSDRIEPFGSLHPDFAGWEAELARLKTAGVRGLKFHCEFQGFSVRDPRFRDMIEAAWRDFILLFHVGRPGRHAAVPELSTGPRDMAGLLRDFPDARIIAAHLGGWSQWDQVQEHLLGRDIFLDTASTAPYVAPEVFRRILSGHARERLLYGSDWPIHDPVEDLGLLQAKLDAASRDTGRDMNVLLANAAALFPAAC